MSTIPEDNLQDRDSRIRCIFDPHYANETRVWCGRQHGIDESFANLDAASTNQLTLNVVACPDCVALANHALRRGHAEIGYVDPAILNRQRLDHVMRHGVPKTDMVIDTQIMAIDKELGHAPQPDRGVLPPRAVPKITQRRADRRAGQLRVVFIIMAFIAIYMIVKAMFARCIVDISVWSVILGVFLGSTCYLNPPSQDKVRRMRNQAR